jgi:hypothetical protein
MITKVSAKGDELYDVIERIYERQRDYREISPISLAREGMQAIDFPSSLHALGYIGCELHLREIARTFCRRRFEPVKTPGEHLEVDLFPETLQERYPVKGMAGDEPRYVLRGHLSMEDRAFNVARMRRASRALTKHADALEAEGLNPT